MKEWLYRSQTESTPLAGRTQTRTFRLRQLDSCGGDPLPGPHILASLAPSGHIRYAVGWVALNPEYGTRVIARIWIWNGSERRRCGSGRGTLSSALLASNDRPTPRAPQA